LKRQWPIRIVGFFGELAGEMTRQLLGSWFLLKLKYRGYPKNWFSKTTEVLKWEIQGWKMGNLWKE